MLFPYTYVPHQMEKMQEFIDFIFFDVWCKAAAGDTFGFDLFNCKPDLREVIVAFHYSDTKGAEFFNGHIERIYNLFAKLNAAQIKQLKNWYQANNDIQNVCENDPATIIIRYIDFPDDLKDLHDQLSGFFKNLYSNLDIAALKAKIGNIDDHYKAFTQTNNINKCPFCGISDLLGEDHSPRDAYDHYLPKAIYPFNSINFKNLMPACHHCNSSYKTSKDPAYPVKDPARSTYRRKFFYPFTTEPHKIDLAVTLHHADIKNLKPVDIALTFGPKEIIEQVDTWKDIYGIEERYKAKFCTESDGKYWLAQVLDEWSEDGRQPTDYLITLTRQAQNRPYAECNFLKKPFLDACAEKGLFNN